MTDPIPTSLTDYISFNQERVALFRVNPERIGPAMEAMRQKLLGQLGQDPVYGIRTEMPIRLVKEGQAMGEAPVPTRALLLFRGSPKDPILVGTLPISEQDILERVYRPDAERVEPLLTAPAKTLREEVNSLAAVYFKAEEVLKYRPTFYDPPNPAEEREEQARRRAAASRSAATTAHLNDIKVLAPFTSRHIDRTLALMDQDTRASER